MLNVKVGIIDYRMGNLTSVVNAVESLGVQPLVVSDPAQFKECSHLILPGVGSFTQGMSLLDKYGFTEALKEECGVNKKPLYGICLGMQLLADLGIEGGETPGLALVPGTVRLLESRGLSLPHIGWNNLEIKQVHPLLPFAADQQPHFYFVHSYCFEAKNLAHILAVCEYGETFAAVIGRENIFGAQFHPEKSQKFGLSMLKAFLFRETSTTSPSKDKSEGLRL